MKPVPAVSVVAVDYRSGDALRHCFESIQRRSGGVSLEFLVVDNGSIDGSLDATRAVVPDLQVLGTGENIGFGAGVNRALERARAPWILVVNPDAWLVDGTVADLVDAAEACPDAGVIGPRMTDAGGALAISQLHFPALWRELAEAVRVHRLPGLARVARAVSDPSRYEKLGRPDWITGAVMLFRRDALDDVGGFDERFFLYWEETDWCLRARQRGWSVAYVPAATFRHVGGGVRRDPALFEILVESTLSFYEKHYSGRRARLHRAVLALNLGLRWMATRLGAAVEGDAVAERRIFARATRRAWRGTAVPRTTGARARPS